MPMPARGPRQAVTVRLPFDQYHEVTRRAAERAWTISDFISYCVVKELIRSMGGQAKVDGRAARRMERIIADTPGFDRPDVPRDALGRRKPDHNDGWFPRCVQTHSPAHTESDLPYGDGDE